MSDITTRCLSLANGALSADRRVNYEFGLVLGVDEFRQEQLYHLEKRYLHDRSLHGFGTVYGLLVTAARPPGDDDELLVTVEPGLAIDQWGRPLLVREAQCARLGAWLARQDPAEVAQHQGPSGELRVCVVGRYDECSDELVPIPGQPCSQAETMQVPSRIRDSFNLELRWEPPTMQGWEVVQRFARLMALVRIEPLLLPHQSDEPYLTTLVRDLDNPDWSLPEWEGSPPGEALVFRLPAEEARAALDRLFTVWVTEVRPRLLPNLTDPAGGSAASEAGVLLACIDFMADTSLPGTPRILDPLLPPDSAGRPFLLHTQLIQELLFLGEEQDERALPQQAFATLQVRGGGVLHAWIHYPEPLRRPAPLALEVRAEGRSLPVSRVEPLPGAPNLFKITTGSGPDELIPHGAEVEVRFHLAELALADGRPLLDHLEAQRFDFVGRDGSSVTVSTIAQQVARTRELATIHTMPGNDDLPPHLELWFHVNTVGRVHLLEDDARPPLIVWRENTGERLAVAVEPVNAVPAGGRAYASRWRVRLTGDQALAPEDQLAFTLFTRRILTFPRFVSLAALIEQERYAFVGFTGNDRVRLFHRVPARAPSTEPSPQPGPSLEEILDAVMRLPALPFVTITQETVQNTDLRFPFELWFHPDDEHDPRRPQPEAMILEALQVLVLAEMQDGSLEEIPVEATFMRQPNVYVVGLDSERWRRLGGPPHLRFVFPIDENQVQLRDGTISSLREYIERRRIKFTGYSGVDRGREVIVAFTRLPVNLPG